MIYKTKISKKETRVPFSKVVAKPESKRSTTRHISYDIFREPSPSWLLFLIGPFYNFIIFYFISMYYLQLKLWKMILFLFCSGNTLVLVIRGGQKMTSRQIKLSNTQSSRTERRR